ncbi:hypothetical protein BUY98_14200 [Staphylococcus gallinarum]|uniref:hypothetical protein n=1 Tax=Staphylococcus gallinarum TaxID=1293 RepID=UPI000E690444|nr:hypothetical protein [Staphylococcus gallinarum]RIL21569.1 hypothetical protein BUY97_12220 [Staphylococcus gallinarum]RIL23765.1 hypothetical protein BUY99_04170 [Staphylococcus gallinarum]RIL27792.1 hypothetical protein BUY98_14200 [Staphylococcus gallinarum]RIL29807.1 hypothetical protein BUY95_03860 [Staphylococcus gallinarum]
MSKHIIHKLEQERNQFKKERDTLIDDTTWYKAKVSRLEKVNAEQLNLLEDFSSFIDYKLSIHPNSDVYKKFRSKLDKLGVE